MIFDGYYRLWKVASTTRIIDFLININQGRAVSFERREAIDKNEFLLLSWCHVDFKVKPAFPLNIATTILHFLIWIFDWQ